MKRPKRIAARMRGGGRRSIEQRSETAGQMFIYLVDVMEVAAAGLHARTTTMRSCFLNPHAPLCGDFFQIRTHH